MTSQNHGSLVQPQTAQIIYAQESPATPQLMVDPLIDKFDLVYLLKNNLVKLIIAPIICAVLAVVFHARQQPLYESSALLMVDSSLDQLLQLESSGQPAGHIQESLKSLEVAVVADSVVLRVVNRLDLRNAPGFLPEGHPSGANMPDTELLHFLREKRIQAALQPETRLIRISVFDPQPDRAKLIAETFVEEFEGFLADQRKDEALKIKKSIEVQVGEAREAALASEAELKKYREENSDFPMEQDHQLFASRLSTLGQDLNAAIRARVELESTNASIEDIDASTNPIDIIEIANYQGISHVSSLLTALTTSKSRLAVAAERYPAGSPSYLSAKAEVDRNYELLQEQAEDIKSSLEAKYNAALKREQLIERELASLQELHVEVKAKSSEFRALQTESENLWALYQNLQQRLGSTIMSTELPGNIATVVSEPLTPFVDSRPPVVLFAAIGIIVGCLISGVWLVIKILSGLPFSHARQLEDRLGLPVIADWTSQGRRDAGGSTSPALLQTVNGNRAQTIQVSAPGLNGQGEAIAESIAELAATSGRKTLLLLINPMAHQANIQTTSISNLHRLAIRPENAMDEKGFSDALNRFRQLYDKIIIESGAARDAATVNWISHFSDQDVVAIGRGVINKSEVASRVRGLYRPNAAPVALMLVDPHSSRKNHKTTADRKGPPASSPPGPVRPIAPGRSS